MRITTPTIFNSPTNQRRLEEARQPDPKPSEQLTTPDKAGEVGGGVTEKTTEQNIPCDLLIVLGCFILFPSSGLLGFYTVNHFLNTQPGSRTSVQQLIADVSGDNDIGTTGECEVEGGTDTHQTYVVQEGDTLSSIAEKCLGAEDAWTTIAEYNDIRLTETNSVFEGQELRIPRLRD